MPEVTVVVPTKNRPALVGRAVAAVLGQVDVDCDVVVVDDGSSGDGAAAVAALAGPRVRVVRHDDSRGLPAARNAGIDLATAPWVAFCDDDDLWAPGKLRAQLDALRAHPGAAWSATGVVTVTEELTIRGWAQPPGSGDIAAVIRTTAVVPSGGSSVLAARQLLDDAGRFDETFSSAEDWECWIRLAERSPIATVPRPLVAYRISPTSMAHDIGRMKHHMDRIVQRYPTSERTLSRRGDWDRRVYLGDLYVQAGRRLPIARHFAAMAWRHHAPKQLAYAAAGLIAPSMAQRRNAHVALRDLPHAWRAEAEAWLAAWRLPAVPSGTGRPLPPPALAATALV